MALPPARSNKLVPCAAGRLLPRCPQLSGVGPGPGPSWTVAGRERRCTAARAISRGGDGEPRHVVLRFGRPARPAARGRRRRPEQLRPEQLAARCYVPPAAVAGPQRESNANFRNDRVDLTCICPFSFHVAAYSKSKSRKDRAPSGPLERPPYRRRRSSTSLGHLKHGVSRVRAAAAPLAPGVTQALSSRSN